MSHGLPPKPAKPADPTWADGKDHSAEQLKTERWANRKVIEELVAERDRYREALWDAIEVAQWMSGSSSFGPDGEAHEGWVKMRPKLFAAMAVLDAAVGGDPE